MSVHELCLLETVTGAGMTMGRRDNPPPHRDANQLMILSCAYSAAAWLAMPPCAPAGIPFATSSAVAR